MASRKNRTPTSPPPGVPRHSLEETLRVARALDEQFHGRPAPPELIARAMGMSPETARFRTLLNAAIEYDLIVRGQDKLLAMTPVSRAILYPTAPGEALHAKRHAITRPQLAGKFYRFYDGKPLPPSEYGLQELQSLGVPRTVAARAFNIIVDNAKDIGAVVASRGDLYLDLSRVDVASVERAQSPPSEVSPPLVPTRHSRVLATARPIIEAIGTDGGLRRGLQVDAYVLQERLGSGFSAEVWAAVVTKSPAGVDVSAGDTVAIKFYYPHALAAPDQVIRIEREFRIASGLRHSNLIRIFEFVLASSRPHHNFLVMDVARGQSLKSLIPPLGLSVQKSLQISYQILLALDELHAAGALHRDIKPGNVAVLDDPSGIHATLLDLGIVSVLHERGFTAASRFLGSKHWAPFEQLVGEPIDQRSDLYSMGAVMFHMLTGDVPYGPKATEAAVAVEMAKKPLRLPDTVRLPSDVRELINACLSTEAGNRPNTAHECLAVLAEHI